MISYETLFDTVVEFRDQLWSIDSTGVSIDGRLKLKPDTVKAYLVAIANFRSCDCKEFPNHLNRAEIPWQEPVGALMATQILMRISTAVGPGAALLAKRTFGTIWKWGISTARIPLGEPNPFAAVMSIRSTPAQPHEPWPVAAIDKAINEGSLFLSTLVMILYDTGQRFGDVVNLTFENLHYNEVFDARYLVIKQEKTGADVDVPLTPRLAQRMLDLEDINTRAGRKPYSQVLRVARKQPKRGQVWDVAYTESAIRAAAATELKKLGLTYPDGKPLRLHGLRKSKAVQMVNAGVTTEEGMAVLGHKTPAMFHHYAQAFSRVKAATRAIEKVERSAGTKNPHAMKVEKI